MLTTQQIYRLMAHGYKVVVGEYGYEVYLEKELIKSYIIDTPTKTTCVDYYAEQGWISAAEHYDNELFMRKAIQEVFYNKSPV